ncbi:MAG: methylmalonyl Co-A mutase-associated GTPase MeaB, partial [Geodermatophilaceae bacterium]|nr:methylmalonyl Co-A mutase-associated GTPase MeaB [Geodermatophilaceae bacterium]
IYVVNKADRDGAKQTVRDLRFMLSLGGRHSAAGAWRPPILSTVASRGEGIEEVIAALDQHRRWLDDSGERARLQQERAAAEIEAIAVATLRGRMGDVHGCAALGTLAQRVVGGELDPYAAADALLEQL